MLKLIAGQYGGRKLVTPKGTATRPTSARVRESLFSMLGELNGISVLDLFAGSGALGLEALSRGAASAVFVERDRAAAECVRQNIDTLAAEARVLELDWKRAVSQLVSEGQTFGLVFLDPPYGDASLIGPQIAELITPILEPDARLVSESDARDPIGIGLPVTRERRYGDTLLQFHEFE